ncbi:response regulator transcription factor [Cryptosporangium minutisporangium]|uniref:Response regulatory domain-containing protein n=1 Tax=Cryptosporangium minutisporangium TaxID=113569 RepID=A0ABP6T9J6_9ACTN
MARLLVVEDEPDLRDLLVQRIEAVGHEVMPVATGAAALRTLAHNGLPDAAVLDVDLPGQDGVALLADLRQRQPELPALFITVLWSGELLARMKATGCPYLTKPFTAADLRAALDDLLGGEGRATVDGPASDGPGGPGGPGGSGGPGPDKPSAPG